MMPDHPMDENEFLVHVDIVDRDGHSHTVDIPADIGLNLMEAACAADMPITSVCGGMGICGGCHSFILSEHTLPGISAQEAETLENLPTSKSNSRLICQIPVSKRIHGLKIQLAPV